MTISEPTTMVTDYLLAVLCAFFAASLWVRSRASKNGSVGLWIAAFGVTGVAALAGGTAHGFRIPLGAAWAAVWEITVWSIALGAALLIFAGVRSALRPEAKGDPERSEGVRWLKRAVLISVIGLVLLVGRVSLHEHFNQNDLYHLVQMAGLYCLYRGAHLLHGLGSSP